jgi:hypothetical protein
MCIRDSSNAGLKMARFRDDSDSGANQQKYLTETAMQLYPIYLEIIQMQEVEQLAQNHDQSIVILKDVIGNVEWYKWKANVPGSTNIKSCNGISPADGVLGPDCQQLVESADHRWVPSMLLFSTFLEGVLTGRIDTDIFMYFPQYVFIRLDSKDQKKLSRKMLEKTGGRYEYIEQVLHPDQEDVIAISDGAMDFCTKFEDKKPSAKKKISEAEEKKEDKITPTSMSTRRQSVRIASSTNENLSTSPNGITNVSSPNGTTSSVSTPIVSNSRSKGTTSPKTGSKTTNTSKSTGTSKSAVPSTNKTTVTESHTTPPQPRRKPKTKTQIFVKLIEDFMRDSNALIQNKGKVIEVLLRGATLIENEDKDEADDNFLKNLQLDQKVIRRMLTLDKKLRTEITEIIHADEAVESSTEKTSGTSRKDDGSSLSSTGKRNHNEDNNQDNNDKDEDDEDEDDTEEDTEADTEAKTTSDDLDYSDPDDDSDDNRSPIELKRKMETKKRALNGAKSQAKRRRTTG